MLCPRCLRETALAICSTAALGKSIPVNQLSKRIDAFLSCDDTTVCPNKLLDLGDALYPWLCSKSPLKYNPCTQIMKAQLKYSVRVSKRWSSVIGQWKSIGKLRGVFTLTCVCLAVAKQFHIQRKNKPATKEAKLSGFRFQKLSRHFLPITWCRVVDAIVVIVTRHPSMSLVFSFLWGLWGDIS